MKESASLGGDIRVKRSAAAAPGRRRLPKLNGRLYVGLTIVTIMGLGSLILPIFSPVDPSAQGT
jgi:peptide/nickel transport system permease protein